MKKLIFFILLFSHIYASTTFFVGTDSHYGKNQWSNNEESNKQAIYDMNKLPYDDYPDMPKIEKPKAVIVTGDLTDLGSYTNLYGFSLLSIFNWDGFISDYGLNGENLLNFPVLEGFGNHDNLSWGNWVKWSIKKRNKERNEKIFISENELHYSWDWDGIHFVQLNVYPGNSEEAEKSLAFLKYDLENNLIKKDTPIILFHHYGFDGYSDDWWTSEERYDYYTLIKDFNVIAIFQGHQHDMFHLVWNGIDVFSSGNLFSNNYLVCIIEDNKLKVFSRKQNEWSDFKFEKMIN